MSNRFDAEALVRHRREQDRFLAEHYASPLPDEAREGFEGLDYYPPDPTWVLPAAYTPSEPDRVPITSSSGAIDDYRRVGSAAVTVDGVEYVLAVLDDGDGGRFIPFRDATSGDTTYVGGRYVGIEGDGDDAVVDFNLSSNPWCVYDEEFSCPLPPAANVIPVRIEAGEKVWVPNR